MRLDAARFVVEELVDQLIERLEQPVTSWKCKDAGMQECQKCHNAGARFALTLRAFRTSAFFWPLCIPALVHWCILAFP